MLKTGRNFWTPIFGNDQAVEVEIGPGKGEFLLASARAHPQRNYFAIERSRSRARQIELKLAAARITNARVLNADASCVLSMLPDACVAAYHIQFPDPWWKRRHQKRRLLTSTFVAALARTLAPDGIITLVTDVPETFACAAQCFAANQSLRPLALPLSTANTSFARKARYRGVPLHGSAYGKSVDGQLGGSATAHHRALDRCG